MTFVVARRAEKISVVNLAVGACIAVTVICACPSKLAEPVSENQMIAVRVELISKEAAERAASLLNVLAGASALVGAICPASCGRSALIVSGAAWFASGIVNHAVITMDGKDFTQLTIPKLPDLELSEFPSSARNLFSNLGQAIGLLNAIYITANRVTAAAEARSSDWLQKQLGALRSYESQLDPVLAELGNELAQYTPKGDPWMEKVSRALASYRAQSVQFYDATKAQIRGLKIF
jgi:hypothetical protein